MVATIEEVLGKSFRDPTPSGKVVAMFSIGPLGAFTGCCIGVFIGMEFPTSHSTETLGQAGGTIGLIASVLWAQYYWPINEKPDV